MRVMVMVAGGGVLCPTTSRGGVVVVVVVVVVVLVLVLVLVLVVIVYS